MQRISLFPPVTNHSRGQGINNGILETPVNQSRHVYEAKNSNYKAFLIIYENLPDNSIAIIKYLKSLLKIDARHWHY